MLIASKQRRLHGFFRIITVVVLTAFIATSLVPGQRAFAQGFDLPLPGTMLRMTTEFMPAMIKGIKVDPQNPLLFEFLIDPGQVPLSSSDKKIEYRKLIKYFLAALTTPEKDMWVNLSPYENSRIISTNFGKTEMGRDMLAQDYILKQLAASLVYPEDGLGKKFWDKVYERVRMETGGVNVPVSTFNKVWIIPQTATIFEKGNVAMITKSHLKVMMEEDYLSLDKHGNAPKMGLGNVGDPGSSVHRTSSEVMREIIIPAIEKEVNEGRNFAQLRQMFNSMVLASWFKQRLKMHLLSRIYVNKNENGGVELQNPRDNEQIYTRYLQAYKKGVYNYIKEEADPVSGEIIPRKYFSGGFQDTADGRIGTPGAVIEPVEHFSAEDVPTEGLDNAMVSLNMTDRVHSFSITKEDMIGLLEDPKNLPQIELYVKNVEKEDAQRLAGWIAHWGADAKKRDQKENVLTAEKVLGFLNDGHPLGALVSDDVAAQLNESKDLIQKSIESDLRDGLKDLNLSPGSSTIHELVKQWLVGIVQRNGYNFEETNVLMGIVTKKLNHVIDIFNYLNDLNPKSETALNLAVKIVVEGIAADNKGEIDRELGDFKANTGEIENIVRSREEYEDSGLPLVIKFKGEITPALEAVQERLKELGVEKLGLKEPDVAKYDFEKLDLDNLDKKKLGEALYAYQLLLEDLLRKAGQIEQEIGAGN